MAEFTPDAIYNECRTTEFSGQDFKTSSLKEIFLSFAISLSIIALVVLGIKRHHCKAKKQTPWYSFYNKDVIFHSSILSTSKNIMLVKRSSKQRFEPCKELTFDESKSLCESFCWNMYFPSTLKENNELRLLLDNMKQTHHIYVNPWLRRIILKWALVMLVKYVGVEFSVC